MTGQLIEEIRARARGEAMVRYVGSFHMANASHFQMRHRPLQIGSSAASHLTGSGTITAFPWSPDRKRRVLLSNNHVLARYDLAPRGEVIVQPGHNHQSPNERGTLTNIVGRLERSYPLYTNLPNQIDAAYASLDSGIDVDPAHISAWGALKGTKPFPAPGDRVFKVGSSTGLTSGIVATVSTYNIDAGVPGGSLTFYEAVEIANDGQRFASSGDSGSLIFGEDGKAFGMLFAAGQQGGLACSLETALTKLGLPLDIL